MRMCTCMQTHTLDVTCALCACLSPVPYDCLRAACCCFYLLKLFTLSVIFARVFVLNFHHHIFCFFLIGAAAAYSPLTASFTPSPSLFLQIAPPRINQVLSRQWTSRGGLIIFCPEHLKPTITLLLEHHMTLGLLFVCGNVIKVEFS